MNDYIEVRFDLTPCEEAYTDVLAAMLADEGFESFVPDSTGMLAYVPVKLYDASAIQSLIDSFPFPTEIKNEVTLIEGQDWNSEWEKNYFKPIVVGDQCVIHSSFHTEIPNCRYDIVIDPKMAFGTGHHATTSLIIEQLLNTDLPGKSVTDMGTGTGILAILAAMRGASPVTAIEIDPAAYENAVDNVALNSHPEIDVKLGDADLLAGSPEADLFLANINRNIVCADLPAYSSATKPGGTVLLSGFYESDIPVVLESAQKVGLTYEGHTVRDSWTCLRLRK